MRAENLREENKIYAKKAEWIGKGIILGAIFGKEVVERIVKLQTGE